MCFKLGGHGFFYIHDYYSAEQARERSCNVMITVLKGNPTVKQMNDAFFLYLGKTWRCSTKLVEPGVFFLRFPNIREVEKACYSDRITMKPCGTVVRVTICEQDDGAKGLLEKAWVKVGGIPTDKRCERNVAFVASLAGVLLEIDLASLHCPDSVRVKLGCRNINEIIPVAESVLGDRFYDFTFEVERVLVRNPDRENIRVKSSTEQGEPSPKKQKRQGLKDDMRGISSGGMQDVGGNKSVGKQCVNDALESPVSVKSDSSNNDTLLIHTMEQEALASRDKSVALSLSHDMCSQSATLGDGKRIVRKTYDDSVKNSIKVTELEGPFGAVENDPVEYSVQSPDSAHDCYGEVIPTPPLLHENTLRFNTRTQMTNLEKVEDRAKAASKKRDLEGTKKSNNSFDILSNSDLMLRARNMGVMIPDCDFSKIDILGELEHIRNSDVEKHTHPDEVMLITNGKGEDIPINLNWGDEQNYDVSDFTAVGSRKKKKSARKIQTSISRPGTRSQKAVEATATSDNGAIPPSITTRGRGGVKNQNERNLLEL